MTDFEKWVTRSVDNMEHLAYAVWLPPMEVSRKTYARLVALRIQGRMDPRTLARYHPEPRWKSVLKWPYRFILNFWEN